MKKLFKELAWFDRLDWGFFTGLSLMLVMTLVLAVLAVVSGASILVPVTFLIIFAIGVYGLVRVSRFAISTQKYISRLER